MYTSTFPWLKGLLRDVSFECFTHHYSHLLESCALGLKETMLKIQCLPLRNLGSIEEANNQGPVHTVLVEKGAGHTDRRFSWALAWRTGQGRVPERTCGGMGAVLIMT